jgi:hypothetical protein
VARLSKQEQAMLEKLTAKSEAPDRSPSGRTVNVNIDLGDPKQVKMAERYGLLDGYDEDDEETEDDDTDADETPKRRGFFDEK